MYCTINFTTSRIRFSTEPFVALTVPKKMSDLSIYTRSIQDSYERGKGGVETPQSKRFARFVSLGSRGAFGLRYFSTAFERNKSAIAPGLKAQHMIAQGNALGESPKDLKP